LELVRPDYGMLDQDRLYEARLVQVKSVQGRLVQVSPGMFRLCQAK